MKTYSRVTIIEDNPTIRESYRLLISSLDDFFVSGTYATCEKALRKLPTEKPDIILIDLELPGMHGIEGIDKIKKILPKVEILVVTVHEDHELVFEALCAGASGYITKSSGFPRLLEALKEVKSGGAPMSTQIARMVIDSFHKSSQSPLSPRETEVLQLMSEGKSYSMIAKELFVDKETIKTHIKNIYWKLEVHSKAQAIEKARKEKLI